MNDQEMERSYIEENTGEPGPRRSRKNYDYLSVESCFVAFVFFTVLSQIILYAVSGTISKPFRPLIILILTVMVVRRGRLKLSVCTTAFVMSVYVMLIWFFYYPKGGSLHGYLITVLYFMMLFSVASFPWNRRELQLIIYATFLATIVLAVVFCSSNNMLDFTGYTYFNFWGQTVNRNKNAYAFALGLILGWQYLSFGKGRNRKLIILGMLLEGYCLIYSQCRGAFIGAFAAICVVVLIKAFNMYRSGNPYLLIYLLTFIFVCILGYVLIKNSPVSRLVDGDNLSGRDEGMKHATQLFKEAPFLGKIFGNGTNYEAEHTVGIGVHFVYLKYLLEVGLVGSGMIVLIFLQSMKYLRGTIPWSLLILAFSKTLFEGMDYYVFIPLILALCISNYERLYHHPGNELYWRERY